MSLPRRRKAPKMGLRAPEMVRCAGHLAWLRGFPCAIAGKHVCSPSIEAAHARLGAHAGMGQKPGDDLALPLCSAAHGEQHTIGEASFQQKYGINMIQIALSYWKASPHRIRYERARQETTT